MTREKRDYPMHPIFEGFVDNLNALAGTPGSLEDHVAEFGVVWTLSHRVDHLRRGHAWTVFDLMRGHPPLVECHAKDHGVSLNSTSAKEDE